LPAFGIKITLTSSHLVGIWFIARQPLKIAVSQGRDISSVRCSWAGGLEWLKRVKSPLNAARVRDVVYTLVV